MYLETRNVFNEHPKLYVSTDGSHRDPDCWADHRM